MANEIPGQIEHLVQEDRLTTPIWYEWFAYLRGAVRSLITFKTNAESAWTPYTPTLTAFAGTFTSASAAARYKAVGKTIHIHVTILITTVGTGTYPVFTLPTAPINFANVQFTGYENATASAVRVVTVALPQ